MTKIKRSQVMTFININPSGAASYFLIGEGVTSGSISYNPKVEEETYIHQDSATVTVESYSPKLSLETSAIAGNEVFDYVDSLRVARAVLAAAQTDIVNVWAYEAGGPSAYPAEKQTVSVQVDEFGGEGGASVKISYTLNFIGDAIAGTFNASTKAFTAS